MASIPPKLVRLLIKTHNTFATIPVEKETMAKIGGQAVAKFDKAKKLEEFDLFTQNSLAKKYDDPKYITLLKEETKSYWNYERPM